MRGCSQHCCSALQQLVAHLVPNGSSKISARQLKMYLGTSLPAYMVPSTFLLCDALPYTANGKVDRKALPAADACMSVQQDKVCSLTSLF